MQLTQWLESHGIFVVGIFLDRFDVAWLVRPAQGLASTVRTLVAFALLVLVFMMLALLEVRDFKAKLQTACPEEFASRILRASKLVAEKFRRYMVIRTIASAATGLMVALLCWALGIELAAVDPDNLWRARLDRRGQVSWISHYIGRSRARRCPPPRHHLNAAFHAGLTMARKRTEIPKLPCLVGHEGHCAAGTLAHNVLGARRILIDNDVVFGALPVDKGNLDSLAFMYRERRVDLALNITPGAHIDPCAPRQRLTAG